MKKKLITNTIKSTFCSPVSTFVLAQGAGAKQRFLGDIMKKRKIRDLVIISIVLPGSMWASAQSSDASEVAMEEVTVMATRREESVMEVPQSVQVISREMLEQPIYSDVRDVYNLVPGATVGITQGGKGPVSEGIMLRGSGLTQTNAGASMQPVGYYIDDIPYIDIGGLTPPPLGTYDFASIEVLRGPQGTTYGQDSSAGSVIMRTSPVDLENFGYRVSAGTMTYAKGSYGNEYSGVINVPIVQDSLGLRLGFESQEDPGYGVVRGRPDVEEPFNTERDTLRAKLTWLPNEGSEVTLSHSRWNTRYTFIPGSNIIDSSNGVMEVIPLSWDFGLEEFPSGIPVNNYDVEWTSAKIQVDLGFASMTYSGGKVDVSERDYNDENIAYGIVSLTNMPAETTTHEIRLVSSGDGPIGWILGYLDMEGESQTDLFYNYQSYGEYSELTSVDLDATAIYGEVTYRFSEQVSVFGGLRKQEEDRKEVVGGVLRAAGDPASGPWTGFAYTNSDSSYSYDNISYRVGVRVNPRENGIVYLTRSSAARAPLLQTPEGRIQFRAQGFPISDSNASEVVSTELGTKWTLMDGAMNLELVYALSEWEDIPLYAGSVSIGGTDADVKSLEAMVSWQLTDNFSLSYAGAYTDSEVTGVPAVDSIEGVTYPSAITRGGELYNYSPMTHSLTANYSMMLESGWQGYAGGTFARREAPDGFSSVLTPSGYITAPSDYEVLNLSAGVRKDQWDINFSIQNATDYDEQYTPDYSGVNQSILMFPRSFHVRVSYSTF